MKTKIYKSVDGSLVGVIENFDDARYTNARSNEEGHVAAGDILSDEDLASLMLDSGVTVFAVME